MSKEELELMKEEEKLKKEAEAKEAEKKKDAKGKGDKKEPEKEAPKAVEVDLDRLEERVVRLTPMSSRLASAELIPDGETLYFLSAFEGGYDLWTKEIRSGEVRLLKKMNALCCLAIG